MKFPSPSPVMLSHPAASFQNTYQPMINPSLQHVYFVPNCTTPTQFFLNPVFNQIESNPKLINEESKEREEEEIQQPQFYTLMSQLDNYCGYRAQPYYYIVPGNYMSMAGANIININNINANGNALIINNQNDNKVPEEKSNYIEKNKRKENLIFKVEIDEDYYQKRYADNNS